MRVAKWWLKVTFVALMVFALSANLSAQSKSKAKAVAAPTPIKVDGKIIKDYVAYLAAPDKEGRKSLTPGFEKTAEWAAARFKEWGLQPAGENGTFLQNVPITGPRTAFAWTTGIPALSVDGRPFYVRDGDFTLDPGSTPGANITAEIVFIGYGISVSAKGLDEYAGIDVKDKIVLALKGSPKDAPAARGMFGFGAPAPLSASGGEEWKEESTDKAKIRAAYDKGAAAILLFSPDKLAVPSPFGPQPQEQRTPAQIFAEMRASAVEGSPYTRTFLVVTDVNERIFRQVMWRDPQESQRAFVGRIDQIRRDIRDRKVRSQSTGVEARIKGFDTTTFYGEKFKNNVSHNVIGKVEGTDPVLKEQVIVVGGHLDHLGMTNGVIYGGADDDASGAALTMEMARLISTNAMTIKPKRTIVFALWCAEEMGLLGSNYYAKNPTDGVKMENVVANFNADMVGLGDRIGAPGALNFPAIFDVIMKNQDPEVAKAVNPSTGGPGGSDFSAFIEQGIEALALMTEGGVGHPDYHDSADRADKIDPDILRKTGQFVLQGVINVANDTSTTMIIPDRLHLYNGMRLVPLNLAEAGAGGGRRMFLGQQNATPGPRFNISLSDVSAFGGNLAAIDVAAKMLSVGRVDVPARGDGQWFGPAGLTERGKSAVAALQTAGISLNLINPSERLLGDMLNTAKRGFIVSELATVPDATLGKKIAENNVLLTVDFDPEATQAIADRLIELKKAIGSSGNLLLVTHDSGPSPMAEMMGSGGTAPPRKVDEAKQRLYLALIKAGWTKDEIYAMVGVSPRTGDRWMPQFEVRLEGNLAKLTQ